MIENYMMQNKIFFVETKEDSSTYILTLPVSITNNLKPKERVSFFGYTYILYKILTTNYNSGYKTTLWTMER